MLTEMPKRGFYVLKDDPKWNGEKEVLFFSGLVLGNNFYCRSNGTPKSFTTWDKFDINRLRPVDILITEFDYYSSWDSIPKSFGVPFLDVAPFYKHEKGRKLHRSEYFKTFIIQDFLKENGWNYTQMSDEAILTVIKRYKGWVQMGFPKSLASILEKINVENP